LIEQRSAQSSPFACDILLAKTADVVRTAIEINMKSSSPLPVISAEQKAFGTVALDYNLQTKRGQEEFLVF